MNLNLIVSLVTNHTAILQNSKRLVINNKVEITWNVIMSLVDSMVFSPYFHVAIYTSINSISKYIELIGMGVWNT